MAVLAVLLYHGGVHTLHGGFLGVDVFFVLSGFLITSLLLTELEGTGRLRFLRFYERRARRLLPGLVLMILLVVVYAYFVVPHGTFPSLPRQVLGTMLYVGNWTLISSHATYFTQGLPTSPLEHTWSLAIEEQFYLVWPITLVALRRLSSRREGLAGWCAAGAVLFAGITALQYQSGTNPNTLYFSTQTHATTMLIGACAACILLRRPESREASHFVEVAPRRRRVVGALSVLAWVGVVVVFCEAHGTSELLYRGGYLAFGLLVATAIGSSVVDPRGPAARLLSWAPVAFLGRISYGVYLYHFPLFLWLNGARTHLSGAALLLVRVAVTLVVATVSYVLVEQPIRQRRALTGRVGLVTAIAAFTATAVVGVSIASAALDVPFPDQVALWNFTGRPPAGTTTTVLIVGDSMAGTLGAGLNNPISRASHVFFAVNGVAKCSLVGGELELKQFPIRTPERCDVTGHRGWPARWRRSLAKWRPDLTMMLFRLDVVNHLIDGRWQHIGDPAFDCVLHARLLEAAATLSSTGRAVVFLTSPYYDTGEQANGAPWPEDDPARVDHYNALLRSVAAEFPGVIHVVGLGALVSPDGRFTRTIGRTVVRWVDGIHFTYAGDAYVLPSLLDAVARLAHTVPSPHDLALLDAASSSASRASCGEGASVSP